MPSRQPPPPAAPPPMLLLLPPPRNPPDYHLVVPLVAAAASLSILLLAAFIIYRKLSRKRTAPAPPSDHQNQHKQHPLRRFPLSLLRRATSSFSPSNRLGQGGFGSVYRGVIPSSGEVVAVKVMDCAGSLQGEREFHNELALAARIISNNVTVSSFSSSSPCESNFLVSVLGYSYDRRGQRRLIVYELMENGSLQDKLLDQKCEELLHWEKRFNVILHIAKALRFLHSHCGPTPVIHGDVKASNVLLDAAFNAKLGDFGLARVLEEEEVHGKGEEDSVHPDAGADGVDTVRNHGCGDDLVNGSIAEGEEEESVLTADDVLAMAERSPESCPAARTAVEDDAASPETAALSATDGFEKASCFSDSCNDRASVESGNRRGGLMQHFGGITKKGDSGRYWWWKQETPNTNCGLGSESGRIKDYVMEWIGNEINKDRPKGTTHWTGAGAEASTSEPPDGVANDTTTTTITTADNVNKLEKKKFGPKKKHWQRFNLWSSMDDSEGQLKRKPREWWKEEFCEELTKKKKKKKKGNREAEMWWQRDDDFLTPDRRKRRRKSRTSLGSIDWWLDGLSGELRSARGNSRDWDIPKSGGISSTPSMRGTVCYIAPEYGGGDLLSEKCDVYSFGVLVLVVISGRRPLQVMASPISEFERANLISWARQLAYNGKLLDLVDPLIQSLDREQVLLCITVALLCLQRTPSKRPNMKEVVDMLSGQAEPPHLPFEFSPSPPSNFPFKSRKKAR